MKPSDGGVVASKLIGNGGNDVFQSISQLSNGSLLLGGTLNAYSSDSDLWVVKLSSDLSYCGSQFTREIVEDVIDLTVHPSLVL